MEKTHVLRIIGIVLLLVLLSHKSHAQHTFSIVAVNTVTGEIGSAGATCLDIDDLSGEEGALVISDIVRGIGAIHSQAFWHPLNQAAARVRMEEGDSPQEILDWLFANDPAPGNNQSRQYGIVDLIGGVGGTPRVAAFTGTSNGSVANHIVGPNYAIQGNILLSQEVLDDMETGFLNASGTLADKLMAAMQGAKRIGAQTSCTGNQTSSKSAFLRVAKVDDLYTNYGHLTVDLNVSKTDFAEDPIDVLQTTYDFYLNTPGTTCTETVTSYPYAESFENNLGLWEQNDLDLSHVGNTDFDWVRNQNGTPTSNTGPSSANDGDFYLYTEATGANVGYPTKRAVLNSPCFDLSSLSGIPTLTFDFHMFGSSTGNMAVRVNEGSGWKTIWLLNGDQGDLWNTANISLEDYSGQTIQIRMDSTTGLGEISDTAIDNVYISGALSIEDIAFELINIYPNPFRNTISINSPKETIQNVTLYDINGRIVSKVASKNALNVQIDTSILEGAMYFVKITTTNGFIIRHIIKR